MIRTFKQYLIESRSAPLYHGTTVLSISDILNQNMIEAKTPQKHYIFQSKKADKYHLDRNQYWGVSLSRSKKKAWVFGHYILELDQKKLSHNYKIVPFNWSDSEKSNTSVAIAARTVRDKWSVQHATEAEEFVLGSIKNLDRYLTAIWLPDFYRDKPSRIEPIPKKYQHLVKWYKNK